MGAATPGYNRGLYRFVVFTAAMTLLLVVAGALVTSNDAGLAVPDWPLSYGTWMPPMVGGILYEHSHRLVASFVGVLTIVLTLWLLWREPRRWVRRVGLVALAAVVTQGILGGLTVLYLLPWPVSTGHATLAQLFFSLLVSLAWVTRAGWQGSVAPLPDHSSPTLRALVVATGLVIVVQLVLGAAFRHHAVGLLPHLVGAAAVSLMVVWVVRRVWRYHYTQPTLRQPALLLAGLLALQLSLGLASYLALTSLAGAPQPQPPVVLLTVAHVAVGALLLATMVVLAIESWRRTIPHQQALELSLEAENAIS